MGNIDILPRGFYIVCATDIEALMGSYDKFLKEGAQVFGISEDSVFSHKAWCESPICNISINIG